MKSIYDEAKQSWERLYKSYEEDYFAPMPTRSDLDTIRIALERAKKIEELLKMYRIERDLQPHTETYRNVRGIISVLEKELEELK